MKTDKFLLPSFISGMAFAAASKWLEQSFGVPLWAPLALAGAGGLIAFAALIHRHSQSEAAA